jgi:hypothetical protein
MNVAALAPLPAELSTTPRVDSVVEQIARAIEKGRVVPGDVLPGQRRLAEQLGGHGNTRAPAARPRPPAVVMAQHLRHEDASRLNLVQERM